MQSSGHTKAYIREFIHSMQDCQDEFDITEERLKTFEKFLSAERLAGYYQLARGNRPVGILLYERNTELSEALYGVVQNLEVVLRNAIHNAIAERFGAANWYDSIGLAQTEIDSIQRAKDSIVEQGHLATPGRIVAELNFGFWVRLTGWPYEKSLWVKYLWRIFPLKVKRPALHNRLLNLKTLRNRIAHHERIIGGKRDLTRDYEELLETISWLNTDLAAWVRSTNRFPERAAKKIRKLPKPNATNTQDPSLSKEVRTDGTTSLPKGGGEDSAAG